MNKSKVLIFCALALFQTIGVQSSRAQELFKALLSATCISTNQNGALVYTHFGNQNLIDQCASDEGVTNTSGLSLVFNSKADALQVVASTNNTAVGTNHVIVGTNQFLICTPLTFTDIVSLSGTNTNKVELLASVFVETNTVASGTLAAKELFHSNSSNQLTSFSLTGQIQYATTASGTNSPMIYRGVLLVGSEPGTGNDGDNDADDNGGQGGNNGGENGNGHGNNGNGNGNGQGNNGNHGNGNNGNHLGQNSHGNGHH